MSRGILILGGFFAASFATILYVTRPSAELPASAAMSVADEARRPAPPGGTQANTFSAADQQPVQPLDPMIQKGTDMESASEDFEARIPATDDAGSADSAAVDDGDSHDTTWTLTDTRTAPSADGAPERDLSDREALQPPSRGVSFAANPSVPLSVGDQPAPVTVETPTGNQGFPVTETVSAEDQGTPATETVPSDTPPTPSENNDSPETQETLAENPYLPDGQQPVSETFRCPPNYMGGNDFTRNALFQMGCPIN